MMKTNIDIRNYAKENGVFLYVIAEELGMNDGNFSRYLRKELSAEEKERIFAIVDRLKVKKDA